MSGIRTTLTALHSTVQVSIRNQSGYTEQDWSGQINKLLSTVHGNPRPLQVLWPHVLVSNHRYFY